MKYLPLKDPRPSPFHKERGIARGFTVWELFPLSPREEGREGRGEWGQPRLRRQSAVIPPRSLVAR